LTWTRKALELAERFNASDVLAGCYNNLGVLSMKAGELDKAVEYYKQGLKIALENKLADRSLTLYNNLCTVYLAKGEFQKLFETAQEGSEMAKKVGALYNLAWLDMMRATSYGNMGDLQKALSIGEDILTLVKRIKYTAFISYIMEGLGICYRWLGEWNKSLKYQMEALDIGKKVGEYQQSGGAASELGELFMEMEDYAEAERYLNESNNIFEKAGDTDAQFTGTLPALSRLCLKKGEIEKAKVLVEKTYAYAAKTKNRLYISGAELLKAMLFREQKNWEQSIQHFEESLQEAKSLNAQKWYVFSYAEILYEYGLMYLERNEEGDKERAYSLLDQALMIYQKADSKKRIEKIIARKKLLTS
jgi:tetratricopeptide (TPR) repeat protein